MQELETLVLNSNKLAMDHLRNGNRQTAYKLLTKAEDAALYDSGPLNSIRRRLLSITYNNMGCYYKRIQEAERALHYLFEAIAHRGESHEDRVNTAGTYINI